MPQSSTWVTSADELLKMFAEALRGLVPIADKARMRWREPDAYDDWDGICEAIYRAIVIGSIEHAEEFGNAFSILPYDRRIASYAKTSFISHQLVEGVAAFMCFETENQPFDTCRFALLGEAMDVVGSRRLALSGVTFVVAACDREADSLKFLEKLTVSL